LFISDLAEYDTVEFVSKSGLLVARKITKPKLLLKEDNFTIELDFPADPVVGCDSSEFPFIPLTLNGVPIVNVMKTTACSDLIVIISDSLFFRFVCYYVRNFILLIFFWERVGGWR
jgi:hypothetical protein